MRGNFAPARGANLVNFQLNLQPQTRQRVIGVEYGVIGVELGHDPNMAIWRRRFAPRQQRQRIALGQIGATVFAVHPLHPVFVVIAKSLLGLEL